MNDRTPESVEALEQLDQRGVIGIGEKLEDALAADQRHRTIGEGLRLESLAVPTLEVHPIDMADYVAGARQFDQESAAVGLRTVHFDHAIDDDHQNVGRRTLEKQAEPPRVARNNVVVDELVDDLARHSSLAHPPCQ